MTFVMWNIPRFQKEGGAIIRGSAIFRGNTVYMKQVEFRGGGGAGVCPPPTTTPKFDKKIF